MSRAPDLQRGTITHVEVHAEVHTSDLKDRGSVGLMEGFPRPHGWMRARRRGWKTQRITRKRKSRHNMWGRTSWMNGAREAG
eukprot:1598239-Pyramimonas_sp.AAC.1